MVTKIKSSKTSGLAAVQPQAPVPFNPAPGADWLQAWVDAMSRIAVEMSNRAPNDTIATFGNLSHDAVGGGFIGPDGQTVVSADMSFVHVCNLILPPYSFYGGWYQMPQYFDRFYHLTPQDNPALLSQLTGSRAFRYLARSMKLLDKDFDTVAGPILYRSFEEDAEVPPNVERTLPLTDHFGSLRCMCVLFHSTVFELKYFKRAGDPGESPLLFRPSHAGVCLCATANNSTEIIINTNVFDFINGRTHAWLIMAGDLADIDWEIFRGRHVYYAWNRNDPNACKDLENALRFMSEAALHGVTVSIGIMGAVVSVLPDDETRKLAYRHELGHLLPEPKRYVFRASDELIPSSYEFPHFWTKGSASLFYGTSAKDFMKVLLKYFLQRRMKIAVFATETSLRAIQGRLGRVNSSVSCISSAILQHEKTAFDKHPENSFKNEVCKLDIKVLFIVYDDGMKEEDLASVLEQCDALKIVTAAFYASLDCPVDSVSSLFNQVFLTAVPEESNVKNTMLVTNKDTGITGSYIFGDDGSIDKNTATDEEMNKALGN